MCALGEGWRMGRENLEGLSTERGASLGAGSCGPEVMS